MHLKHLHWSPSICLNSFISWPHIPLLTNRKNNHGHRKIYWGPEAFNFFTTFIKQGDFSLPSLEMRVKKYQELTVIGSKSHRNDFPCASKSSFEHDSILVVRIGVACVMLQHRTEDQFYGELIATHSTQHDPAEEKIFENQWWYWCISQESDLHVNASKLFS